MSEQTIDTTLTNSGPCGICERVMGQLNPETADAPGLVRVKTLAHRRGEPHAGH